MCVWFFCSQWFLRHGIFFFSFFFIFVLFLLVSFVFPRNVNCVSSSFWYSIRVFNYLIYYYKNNNNNSKQKTEHYMSEWVTCEKLTIKHDIWLKKHFYFMQDTKAFIGQCSFLLSTETRVSIQTWYFNEFLYISYKRNHLFYILFLKKFKIIESFALKGIQGYTT